MTDAQKVEMLRAALEKARTEMVVSVAFLVRDIGTPREAVATMQAFTALTSCAEEARAALAATAEPSAPLTRMYEVCARCGAPGIEVPCSACAPDARRAELLAFGSRVVRVCALRVVADGTSSRAVLSVLPDLAALLEVP